MLLRLDSIVERKDARELYSLRDVRFLAEENLVSLQAEPTLFSTSVCQGSPVVGAGGTIRLIFKFSYDSLDLFVRIIWP